MGVRGIAALAMTLSLLVAVPAAQGAAGLPDPTFGSGGFTIFDEPADFSEQLQDLVIQPDGKILAGGHKSGSSGFLLTRFNPDGSPDIGFGVGGFSILPDPGTGSVGAPRAIADIEARADGKILAAGLGRGVEDHNAFMFARYTPEGELDTSWGKGGLRLVSIAPYGSAHGLALAPDGKVVAVGDGDVAAYVARLTEDGKNDGSFNPNLTGLREVDVQGTVDEDARTVKVLADGTILLAGGAGSQGAFLAELDVNGEPVPGFGTAGIATRDLGTHATPSGSIQDIELLPDGRILAAGLARSAAGDNELVVARFTAAGDLDPTFAGGGVFHGNPTPGTDRGESLAIQPDGKIVAAGLRGEISMEASGDTSLVRLTPEGQLDPSFGTGGEAFAGASPQKDQANALALQGDGRPVIVGYADVSGAHQLLAGRFTSDEAVKVTLIKALRPKAKCAGRRATIVGTGKADRIKGTGKADVIATLGGNDKINAKGGNDVICAGKGKDVVKGGKGRDRILGQGGKDRLIGGPGKDICNGGPGKDAAAGCERP